VIGLTSDEARSCLDTAGPNVLPVTRPPSAWRKLAAQLTHFFAVMLWVAGLLAFVAGLPELGVAIFLVVIINGVFAFIQESRAEQAAARLRDLLPRRAMVLRDGQPREIDARELVVDDVVLLSAGDRISADLRALTTADLTVDTSALTGESEPATAESGDDLFAGTFVVEGEAQARVTAIGSETRLAGIARMTSAGARPRGPLAKELDRVVRIISVIALTLGASFFGIALLIGTPATDGFLFAIGVTVALVPEGLLPTVTLSLAIGAQRMARQSALIRRLEAVETLGSTTFICTDKTGTLTRNEMSIVEVWTPDGPVRVRGEGYDPQGTIEGDPPAVRAATNAACVARRCSIGVAVEHEGRWIAQGDPMEAAIDALARRLGTEVETPSVAAPERARYPFDPRRRRMSVWVGDDLLVKGAPDTVLPRCNGDVSGARDALDVLARRGLRVIAVACRSIDAGENGSTADDVETGLTLLGLLALEDPPRGAAKDAIASCRRSGIRIAMITGDHPATAMAIAREVGLARGKTRMLLGTDLPEDEEVLGALLDYDGVVVARVAPEDKLRIAHALRSRGHVVAMTGDGVNDGPALHAADIGIAMGRSGTDVAREAADLVLLDDDFATIVAAIKQGRATFTNIRRFLTYHLTDNVAELTPFVVWALSGGRFPLALTVLQVLCLDIGTDLLPALALGAEAPGAHAGEGPPPRGHLLDRGVLARVFGVLGPTEALVSMAAFITTFLLAGWRPGDPFPSGPLAAASGAAFSAVVFGQIATAFACRSSTRRPGQLGWTTNRLLLVAVGVELAALAFFLFVPPIADLLRQAPPTFAGLIVALAAVPAVLGVDALDKARRRRAHPEGI
jgi:magnesium-transporting ATPase (P-type)